MLTLIIFFFCLPLIVFSTDVVIAEDEFAADTCTQVNVENSFEFISSEFRYNCCKKSFEKDFDENNAIKQNYLKCLSPPCNSLTSLNPCRVECLFDHSISGPFIPRIDNQLKKNSLSCQQCNKYRSDNSYAIRVLSIQDTRVQCGPNHFCTKDGCCQERVTEAPPTTPTTTPPTTTTTTTTTTPLPVLSCPASGLYSVPNDVTGKRFFRCQLKSVHIECPLGEIFDDRLVGCRLRPSITSTTTTKGPEVERDWRKCLSCAREGLFRNPFDCHSFFRCYTLQTPSSDLLLEVFHCPDDTIFDDSLGTQSTCVTENTWQMNHNQSQCTAETVDSRCYNGIGLYKHQDDCTKIYQCQFNGHVLIVREGACVKGYYFSEHLKQCIPIDNEYCNK